MQRGHGTGADPGFDGVDGAAAVDPADLWVLDPATGEYRMRLPGELPRPAASRPAPGPVPAPASDPVQQPARPGGPRRAARRRQQARSGPWLAGVACFLLAVGGGCIYVLAMNAHGGSAQAATADSAAASPSASCSATLSPGAKTVSPDNGV